ncbi:MAG: DUF4124 domain-containing protein [Gammaproteobacteria bacterium]
MTGRLLVAMLAFGLAAATASAGTVYKWVDQNGQVHYSEHKPDKGNAQAVHVSTGSKPAKNSKTPRNDQQSQQANDQDNADPQASDGCKMARKTLAQYQKADYLYRQDANGKRQVLSKEEKAKAMAQAKNDVKRFCKDEDSQ